MDRARGELRKLTESTQGREREADTRLSLARSVPRRRAPVWLLFPCGRRDQAARMITLLLFSIVAESGTTSTVESADSKSLPLDGGRTPSQIQNCIRDLRWPHAGSEPPWVAVYGDSLARGIYFDTIEALNSSSDASSPAAGEPAHPGHGANYTHECTILESRPPLRRQKCGGFAYDWEPDARWRHSRRKVRAGGVHAAHPPPTGDDVSSPEVGGSARLSFRLKTFTWEPEYDVPWLGALKQARRLPDVLLLSFGIWDMQYPPAEDPELGVLAFQKAFAKFLAALERSLQRLGRRPQVFWLSVTAVAEARLPEWKRPRMSAALSQRYNAIARPLLEASHIQVIDTYTSGHAHPEQSVDGVHFAAPISRHHAQLFWQRLCTSVEEDFEMGQRPFERRRAARKQKLSNEQRAELRRSRQQHRLQL